MSLNQLTIEELEVVFNKIYENACELLYDAELLFSKKRYARSYLCSHIAFEEFAKLPMLHSVALDIHYGNKVDWKNLNKNFRSHESKITQSYISILIILNDFLKRKGYSTISLQAAIVV